MITELQTLRRNAKNYFNKLGVPSWSSDYAAITWDNSEVLEMVFAYGSSLHEWIRNKEEYDTERVMDIFAFKNSENYSWEWVDTNTINLYRI